MVLSSPDSDVNKSFICSLSEDSRTFIEELQENDNSLDEISSGEISDNSDLRNSQVNSVISDFWDQVNTILWWHYKGGRLPPQA